MSVSESRRQSEAQEREIVGPQLVFDKEFLCMKSLGDQISKDQVTITNMGTTTIYYDWRKVERGDYIEAKRSDGVQRFFGITIRNKLLPKESKTFTFSFRSTIPGMFFEEWEIITEPVCLQPLKVLTLNGISIEEETEIDELQRFDKEVGEINQNHFIDEIVDDIIDRVRTPTPPLPEMQEPTVFAKEFEEKNKKYGLWFGSYEMNAFYDLLKETHARLGTDPDAEFWDGSIDYIYNLIQKVEFDIARDNLLLTFNRLVSYSKKVPADRAMSYSEIKESLLRLCDTIPELDESTREEMGMPEYQFEYVTDEMTEEEITKMKEDAEARKAEWMKKHKKKPKGEEEEAQDMEELKKRISEEIKRKVVHEDTIMGDLEDKLEMKTLHKYLDDHVVMNKEKWDELYRKKSILDIGCEGKNVLLRLDLDVPLSEYVPPELESVHEKETKLGAKIADEGMPESTVRSEYMKSGMPSTSRKSRTEVENKNDKVSTYRHYNTQDILQTRQIIDSTKIKKSLPMIKYLMENLAIRTFVIGNLGEKSGKVKPENTMKFVWNAISNKIDQQVHFQEEYEFEEDTEGVYILENLNFHPEEWGFIEPEPVPEPEHPEGEGEGDAEPEPVDDKKNKGKTAKDKKAEEKKAKEAEEARKAKEAEEKKKAEEEKKAEGEGEGEGEGDHEPQEEPEPEITYKEIEAFKQKLASLGDVYINDALDASLTNSNTVADLRTEMKVMGIRMTEEVRKLAMFFKYEHNPTVVVIGGSFKTSISDRILLFNSLIYCTDVIFIAGIFALYFLKVLGVKLGPQEELIQHKYLDICKQLLLKAHEKGVKVILPTDFVTLSKPRMGHENTDEGEGNPEGQEEVKEGEQEQTKQEGTIEAVGEVNWIDLIYDDGTQHVDFSNFIEKKLNELLNPKTEEVEEKPEVPEGEGEAAQPPAQEEAPKEGEGEGDNAPQAAPEPAHELGSKEFILEFGNHTVKNVMDHTRDAMKVFWDGSISLYPDTFAHENNKQFTLDLLRIRHENEDRTEPKYSLIHGEETDLIAHQSMSKIKLEQMDNKDAEGSMGGGFDESGSMTSTFQQDNASPAIFVCAEGRFTLQILQGIENKCLMNIDEHPALTQEQIEDDLAILEEI